MQRVVAVASAVAMAWVSSAFGQGTEATPRFSRDPASKAPLAARPPDSAKSERERDVAKAGEPMKFARVRSASPTCGNDCPEWIAAEGRIMPGVSAQQLRRLLATLGDKRLPIFVHSAGGAVEEAYAMGRLIRAKGLSVSVTKTDYVDCLPSDKECRLLASKGIRLANPKIPLSVCASSCVFLLAGGVQRHVGPLSLVGVHQYESSVTQVQVLQKYRMVPHPRTGEPVKEVISEERVSQKTIKTKTREEVYDKSEAFFREMGVASAIMTPLKATPHASMHWLSPLEVNETRIATDRKAGTQVVGVMPPLPTGTTIGPPTQAASNQGQGPAARGQIDPLARHIQAELRSGNCLTGDIDGGWTARARLALAAFSDATGTRIDPARPTESALATVRSAVAARGRVCATPVR